jgi:siroheme synthase (precorrin-2 oxidase/ferrochelatase)
MPNRFADLNWDVEAGAGNGGRGAEHKGRTLRLRALVDTGASTSVISKRLADELGSFILSKSHTSSGPPTERGN